MPTPLRTLLVFGRDGQVGRELARQPAPPEFRVVCLGRREADITDAAAVEAAVSSLGADLVINAAAYTAVDRAESEPEAAHACNRDGPAHLAAACARHGVPMIHLSTDYVFDGAKPGAWRERDPTGPLGVYGASKLAGERAVRERLERHIILRTSWVYGAAGQNFVKTMVRLAAERPELRVVADQTGCPTAATDIARAALALAGRLVEGWGGIGLYHYCGRGETTWHGFAEEIVRLSRDHRGSTPRVIPIATADYPTPARRPANSVLDCARIERDHPVSRPDWRDSLATVIAELHQA